MSYLKRVWSWDVLLPHLPLLYYAGLAVGIIMYLFGAISTVRLIEVVDWLSIAACVVLIEVENREYAFGRPSALRLVTILVPALILLLGVVAHSIITH